MRSLPEMESTRAKEISGHELFNSAKEGQSASQFREKIEASLNDYVLLAEA